MEVSSFRSCAVILLWNWENAMCKVNILWYLCHQARWIVIVGRKPIPGNHFCTRLASNNLNTWKWLWITYIYPIKPKLKLTSIPPWSEPQSCCSHPHSTCCERKCDSGKVEADRDSGLILGSMCWCHSQVLEINFG